MMIENGRHEDSFANRANLSAVFSCAFMGTSVPPKLWITMLGCGTGWYIILSMWDEVGGIFLRSVATIKIASQL